MTLLAQHEHTRITEWRAVGTRVAGVGAALEVLADDRRHVRGNRADVACLAVLRVGLLARRNLRCFANGHLGLRRYSNTWRVSRRRMGVKRIKVAASQQNSQRKKYCFHSLNCSTIAATLQEKATFLCLF